MSIWKADVDCTAVRLWHHKLFRWSVYQAKTTEDDWDNTTEGWHTFSIFQPDARPQKCWFCVLHVDVPSSERSTIEHHNCMSWPTASSHHAKRAVSCSMSWVKSDHWSSVHWTSWFLLELVPTYLVRAQWMMVRLQVFLKKTCDSSKCPKLRIISLGILSPVVTKIYVFFLCLRILWAFFGPFSLSS